MDSALSKPLPDLADPIHQARDFIGWPAAGGEDDERFGGQVGLHVNHHVEAFPPAIEHFEAGGFLLTANLAVSKIHVATQPGTSPLQTVWIHQKLLMFWGMGWFLGRAVDFSISASSRL